MVYSPRQCSERSFCDPHFTQEKTKSQERQLDLIARVSHSKPAHLSALLNTSFFFFFGLRDLSSPTRDRTWAPAVDAPSPNHWTAKEFPFFIFFFLSFFFFFPLWPRHTAFRIFIPRPGIEPAPPAVEAWSLNHWATREVPPFFLLLLFTFFPPEHLNIIPSGLR